MKSHAPGPALDRDMRNRRVGVVGCDGPGSAAAMLLERLGVGRAALFDRDLVETTNLNRLHGALAWGDSAQLAGRATQAFFATQSTAQILLPGHSQGAMAIAI